jgi:hypothetical protein
MILRPRRLIAPLLVLIGVLAPRVGHACAATEPGIPVPTPVDGGQLPANAAIRFDGPASFAEVTVTVDGAPATLERADFPYSFGVAYFRVTPTPSPGQTIVVGGNFCYEPDTCEATWTFTAAAPDTTAPAAATGLEFDLQRFPEQGGGGSCMVLQDHAWFARWNSAAEADTSGAVHVLELAADESFGEVLASEVVPAGDGTVGTRLPLSTAEVPGAVPESFCLRVRTLDLAGNEGTVSESVCTPQHCRVEPDDFLEDPKADGTAEPAWTDDDVYAGGPCGSKPKTGCTAAQGPTPVWLLLALVPLLLRRRTRA